MTEKATTAKNFTTTNLGSFSNLLKETAGNKESKESIKTFLKDSLGLTSMEISVTSYPAGFDQNFFHSHKQNEELYVVLKGRGQMQLDDDVVDLEEGTLVRVSPNAHRRLRASKDSELVYLCIQAKDGSLEQCTRADGVRQERETTWN